MFSKEELNSISNDLYTLLIYLNSRVFNPGIMLKGLSIPPSHMKAIFFLIKIGPCPVSKLAKDLSISKPNMTPIIDNLISEGFVSRYDDPNDRRVIMIAATPKAHDLLKKKEQMTKESLAERISFLSSDDLETLKKVIPQLTDIIIKMNSDHQEMPTQKP